VAPYNENDKLCFKPLFEWVHPLGVRFMLVLADGRYSPSKVRDAARAPTQKGYR